MAQAKKRAAAPGNKAPVKRGDAPKSAEAGAEPPGVKKMPLKELGKRLPVGSLMGGTLVKDLTTRPWKTKDDRELGREKKKDTTPSRYIGMILRRMCPTLADYKAADYPDEDLEKALVKLGQMFTADIFYAYIQVRIEALGPELPLQVTCGQCKHNFKFVGQLDTIDTYVVEDPRDMFWEFNLRDGAEIRGKEVNKFVMGPTRWTLMEEAIRVGRNGDTVDVAGVKLATARGAIHSLGDDEAQVQLAEVELDDMSKFDMESLISEINEHSLGPAMVIEGNCPKCNHAFRMPIDWEANDFFAISSRS